jgi:hypothetical protein
LGSGQKAVVGVGGEGPLRATSFPPAPGAAKAEDKVGLGGLGDGGRWGASALLGLWATGNCERVGGGEGSDNIIPSSTGAAKAVGKVGSALQHSTGGRIFLE